MKTLTVFVVLFGGFLLVHDATSQIFKPEKPTITKQTQTSQKNSCDSCSSCGVPGIPGTHGIPGNPGQAGRTGRDGAKGYKGNQGRRGTSGSFGAKGEGGIPGTPGDPGKRGFPGKTGPHGAPGSRGFMGGKGERGQPGILQVTNSERYNWKQCVWNREDDTDTGKIQECAFTKKKHNTALKVSFQGNLRVYGSNSCRRWYFKFNDLECSGPVPIEAVFKYNFGFKTPDILVHRNIEGYCTNIPRGNVRVALWVGACPGSERAGNANTGFKSVSRIMMEEVPPSQ